MIQHFRFFPNPQDATDIPRRACIQLPQRNYLIRRMRQPQRQRRMLSFQRRRLRLHEGLIRRHCNHCRKHALSSLISKIIPSIIVLFKRTSRSESSMLCRPSASTPSETTISASAPSTSSTFFFFPVFLSAATALVSCTWISSTLGLDRTTVPGVEAGLVTPPVNMPVRPSAKTNLPCRERASKSRP